MSIITDPLAIVMDPNLSPKQVAASMRVFADLVEDCETLQEAKQRLVMASRLSGALKELQEAGLSKDALRAMAVYVAEGLSDKEIVERLRQEGHMHDPTD